MLGSLRKASNSWVIKILFVILIIAFGGLWGVGGLGDVMSMRFTARPAIEVGDVKVTPEQVVTEFRRDVDQLRQMSGGKFGEEQARQFGFLDQTVDRIVQRSLLDQNVKDLGLTIDDATLRKTILSLPAFQNQLHQFDRQVYQSVLQTNGLNEQSFVAMERSDLVRSTLSDAITNGVTAPSALVDPLFRYRQEKRIAETITFPAASMPAPAKPDDATLQTFHKDHAAQFTAPELRAVSAILIRTTDVAAAIKPSNDDIEKSYQSRLNDFVTPDKRTVRQVLFDKQEDAQAFVDKIRGGADFAATAKAAGKQVDDLGSIERQNMPVTELADAAFGADGTGVVGPVQTALGWHALDVTAIAQGQTRPLSEVRDQIVKDLVQSEAINQLFTLSTKIEDSLGSGAPIDETANSLGLKVTKIAAIDQSGQDADGKPIANLPVGPSFLETVFNTAQGTTSEVVQLENDEGYFVLRVDNITPPALKPFESVKDQVLAAWTRQQQSDAAHKLAEAAVERLNKGEVLAAVAGSYKVATTQPFLRAGDNTVPPLLAAEMFKAQPGSSAVVGIPEGSVAARLKSIVPADPKQAGGVYQQTRDQVAQALGADLMNQYMAALQRQYGVTVNQAVIAQQFSQQ